MLECSNFEQRNMFHQIYCHILVFCWFCRFLGGKCEILLSNLVVAKMQNFMFSFSLYYYVLFVNICMFMGCDFTYNFYFHISPAIFVRNLAIAFNRSVASIVSHFYFYFFYLCVFYPFFEWKKKLEDETRNWNLFFFNNCLLDLMCLRWWLLLLLLVPYWHKSF